MKTSDYIIIGVAVLLVLIIIFVTWLYFYRKKRQVGQGYYKEQPVMGEQPVRGGRMNLQGRFKESYFN